MCQPPSPPDHALAHDSRWVLVLLCLAVALGAAGQSTLPVNDTGIAPLFDTLRGPVSGDGYILHFIQLDDRGFFRDSDPQSGRSRQLAAALRDIRSAGQRNSLTVVFVHGWKHNAAECDDNVLCFQSVLAEIARIEKTGHRRHVVGIYVGWQGKTAQTTLFQQLTFWDRKKAIDAIGSSGRVTYVLSALHDVTRTASSPLVIIGHSFGARLVFEAVSQPLISEVMQANNHVWGEALNIVQTPVRGFGDLVVLLNPAFEAAKYDTLNLFALTAEGFPNEQHVRLLIISTNNDEATSKWFPLGMQAELKWLINPPPELTTTVGNYSEYQTHVLLPCSQSSNDLAAPRAAESIPTTPCACASSKEVGRPSTAAELIPSAERCYGGASLRETGRTSANNPFIVSRTDYRLIDGHNGIFSPALLRFLIEYVSANTETRPPV